MIISFILTSNLVVIIHKYHSVYMILINAHIFVLNNNDVYTSFINNHSIFYKYIFLSFNC